VVDHHSKQDEIQAEFIDIRPNMRSTATILTQYLQAGILDFNKANPIHL
jgi:nanoRNase/pAp phosphatase (c-di-AMP/oligoRNAs hydrolase)